MTGDLIARRQNVFDFYVDFLDPRFCITVPVELPDFRTTCRERSISSFQFFLWQLAGTSLDIPNLTLRHNDDGLFQIDSLVVSYVALDANENINFVTIPFHEEMETFIHASETEKARVERLTTLQIEDTTKQNYFFSSALPWFDVLGVQNAFSHRDSAQIPTVVFGKFKPFDQGLRVNVSFQTHHGLADGFHAHQYFERLRDRVQRFVST